VLQRVLPILTAIRILSVFVVDEQCAQQLNRLLTHNHALNT